MVKGSSDGVYRGGRQTEQAGRVDRYAPGLPAVSSVEGRRQDDERERTLIRALDRAATSLEQAVRRGLALEAALRRKAGTDRDRQLTSVRRAQEVELAKSGNHVAQQVIEHRTTARAAAAELAVGTAGASWDDDCWAADRPARPPAAVRLGDLTIPAGSGVNERVTVPLVVPLLNSSNLVVCTDVDDTCRDLPLAGTVLRLLAAVTPGNIQVHWYDPRLRSDLASFSALRSTDVPVLGPAVSTEEGLDWILGELTRDVSRISELLRGRYSNLGSLEAAAGNSGEPYRLLVVYDFPNGFDERSFKSLIRLMERGPACGIHVLLHHDHRTGPPRDCDAAQVHRNAAVVQRLGTCWAHPRTPKMSVALDPPPPLDLIEAVSRRTIEQARTAGAPSLHISSILPPETQWWSRSSGESLRVHLGRAALAPVEFTLGNRLEQRHNVLVGGAVGQGKSNVLLVLIHTIAAMYPPSEVEFFLLDFKEGLEFSRLAPSRDDPSFLPHARVLGLESDRAFGLAILRHLQDQFNHRSRTFKEADVSEIEEYRRKRPADVVPRLVVILDEFQVLFERDDAIATEAVDVLEILARKGRAYGIHLVLASQTLSGIRQLIAKEGSIFSQVPIRVALKTSPAESQVLLQPHNTEAARLRYRGEAVFNRDGGDPEDNQRITVAFADPAFCRRIREEAVARFPDHPTPLVFNGSEPSDALTSLLSLERSRLHYTALLGLPVSYDRAPTEFHFSDEPGRHLVLVGPGSEPKPAGGVASGYEALATLQAACLSIGRSGPPAQFVLLDWMSQEQQALAALAELAMVLQTWDHDVSVYEGTEAVQFVAGLSDLLKVRTPGGRHSRLFLVGWGVHRAAGLDTPDPISQERPADALHLLIKDGPVLGAHLIGWWNSYKTYEQHVEMNFGIAGLTQGFFFLRSPQTDVSSVMGPFVEWHPQPNRSLFFDRGGDEHGVTVVPFAPMTPAGMRMLQEYGR